MPTLEDFMDSLTHEQYKLVQMGTIKSTKDKSLATSILNQAKGKNKSKYLKQHEKKKAKYSKQQEKKNQEKLKSSDGGLNPSKDKEKKKKEKRKSTYCHKVWNI